MNTADKSVIETSGVGGIELHTHDLNTVWVSVARIQVLVDLVARGTRVLLIDGGALDVRETADEVAMLLGWKPKKTAH